MVQRMMANDENKDGKITKDELPEFMQQMMSRMDTNEDGAIDKKEVEAMAERFQRAVDLAAVVVPTTDRNVPSVLRKTNSWKLT